METRAIWRPSCAAQCAEQVLTQPQDAYTIKLLEGSKTAVADAVKKSEGVESR